MLSATLCLFAESHRAARMLTACMGLNPLTSTLVRVCPGGSGVRQRLLSKRDFTFGSACGCSWKRGGWLLFTRFRCGCEDHGARHSYYIVVIDADSRISLSWSPFKLQVRKSTDDEPTAPKHELGLLR